MHSTLRFSVHTEEANEWSGAEAVNWTMFLFFYFDVVVVVRLHFLSSQNNYVFIM